MATYQELHALRGAGTLEALLQKINVAIAIKATALAKSANPTPAQVAWAKVALASPDSFQGLILNYLLADNAAATSAQIIGASDATVQTAVNAAVTALLEI